MTPVPKHLRSILEHDSGENSDVKLTGSIRCSCGSGTFEVLHSDVVSEEQREGTFGVVEINSRFFLVVQAHCVSCGCAHLLLDVDFHGWDGVICHDFEQASQARPPLVVAHCPVCGGTNHEIRIVVLFEDLERFEEEGLKEEQQAALSSNVDLQAEAFSYIELATACCQCGEEIDPIVSYEA